MEKGHPPEGSSTAAEPTRPKPRFPDVQVDLGTQRGRPVAMLALVRRALQKAGYREEAETWTRQAMAEDEDGIRRLAHELVEVI